MSKKTSTKKPAKAKTKAAKSKAAAKTKPGVTAATKPVGECPKGGAHEWTEENGENFCSKCKEPKSAKTKPGRQKAAKPASDKKLSAIEAAAQLLGETGEPMNCKTIIDAIAKKGWWTSPGGKTPHATLYSSIIREISVKGKESRFKKTDRGNFEFNG